MTPHEPTQSGRGSPRFPAGLPAEVRLPAARYPCEVTDLSRSGALLTGSLPARPDRQIEVVLSSATGDLRFRLRARVVRVAPGNATHVGVAFQEVKPDERKRVEHLLSRIIEGSGTGLLATLDPTARSAEVRAALARMPVAHRIGLAGRAQAQERRFLRLDPNPLVLEALAHNPNTGADEAVALLGMPTLRPTTITVLADAPHLRGHEELQLLLASHPRATLQAAKKVADRMSPRGRARLLARPNLRAALRRKLGTRGGPTKRA